MRKKKTTIQLQIAGKETKSRPSTKKINFYQTMGYMGPLQMMNSSCTFMIIKSEIPGISL